MSELLLKAKQNLDVAHELLQKNKHFAPIVHCSYYMCVQLMIHCLLNDGMTEEQIRLEYQQKGGSSHNYYIYQTVLKISKVKGKDVANRFNSKIKDLKSYREQSDYGNVSINQKKANDSLMVTLEIKDIFRTALGVTI